MVIQCFYISLWNQQQHNKYIQKTGRQQVEIKFQFFKKTIYCKSEFILVSLSLAIIILDNKI